MNILSIVDVAVPKTKKDTNYLAIMIKTEFNHFTRVEMI